MRESSLVANPALRAAAAITATYLSRHQHHVHRQLRRARAARSAQPAASSSTPPWSRTTFAPAGSVVSVDAGGEITTRSSILLDPCSGTVTSPAADSSLADADVCLVGGTTSTPVVRSCSPRSAGPVGRSPVTAVRCRCWSRRSVGRRAMRGADDARGAPRPTPSPANPCTFGAVEPEAWALTARSSSTRRASTPRTATPATACATRGAAAARCAPR